jgi:tRNA (cmo5U34)-methyltransferase
LAPGGVFLNLEHVASATADIEKLFKELFIDHLWAYHQKQGSSDNRQQIADAYYNRPDKAANLLAPVETQCDWLREIGFGHVDCFFKIFELALFGGVKG